MVVNLPSELLTAICVLVACPTVVSCRLVCRRFRDVIDGSLELQYRIELERDGLIDVESNVPPCQFLGTSPSQTPITQRGALATTSAERLVRLRALRRAWETLTWSECVTIPMPGPCCAYELVGGVFCKTQPTVRRAPNGVPPGVAAQGGPGRAPGIAWPAIGVHAAGEAEEEVGLHGSRTMSATWLPAARRPRGASGEGGWHTAVRDDLGVPTRDFAMDPSQDLMVLFMGGEDPGMPMVVFPGVLELHVRTMSTNQAHPEARVPVLSTTVLYPVTSVFVQIVDDVVGIMYCVDPARPRLTIWNWKTGQMVVDRTSSHLPSATWDFSFIHSRALFVTTGSGSGTLELFTFTCDPAYDAGEGAYDASLPPSESFPGPWRPEPWGTLTHVATLRLPPIHTSVRVLNVGTHTGPFMAACPADAAFVSSNAARMYVLAVQYVHLPTLDGPRTRPRMCVFVHHRTLARYVVRGAGHVRDSEGDGAPLEVPWAEWGPTQARMMPHVGLFQWLRYVHGQRVVMLSPTSKAGQSTLQVLDFNVRRASKDGDAGGWHPPSDDVAATRECVYRPTRIAMPNIFVDVVESGLPYRDVRRDVQGEYSGVMIDDERLVGLKFPAFLTGDMKEIDVFTM